MGTQTPLVLHPSQAGPFSSFTPAQVSQCPSLSSARHHLTPNLHVSLSSEGLQEAQEDASSLTRSDLPTLATATIQQLACPHWLSLETPQHRDRSPLSPAPGWWPGPGGGGDGHPSPDNGLLPDPSPRFASAVPLSLELLSGPRPHGQHLPSIEADSNATSLVVSPARGGHPVLHVSGMVSAALSGCSSTSLSL